MSTSFTERDGRELAASMIRELQFGEIAELSIEPEHRPHGAPQTNVVLRFLNALRDADSRTLDAGFAAVITDFIACCLDGAVPDATFYDTLTDG